jgi:DNA-binding CsgD family transcriptional regulator
MSTRLSIRTADLERLRAVTDTAHAASATDPLPDSVLAAIGDLIPSDKITYQVFDPIARVYLVERDFGAPSTCLEPDPVRMEEFFWRAFWSSPVCSYPQQTGRATEVRRASDFMPARDFTSSLVGELFRLQAVRHNALVPLTPDGCVDHRIELWRANGSDFTDKEQLLLSLLRPHLAEFESTARTRACEAVLTSRQVQLLRLVGDGLTNRQIARRLDRSEGTVRRHLENIFDRLGVTSRTAAAAHLTHPH